MQKTARKNTKYSRNEIVLKIGEGLTLENRRRANARNVSFSIYVRWSVTLSTLLINQIFIMGYSLCKILTLDQKLIFQKTCHNPFYKSFRVVLLQKTRYIREMRPFLKSAIMQGLKPLGTDSYETISKRLYQCCLLIGQKNPLYYSAQAASSSS